MTEQTALMDDAGAPETGTPPRQPRTRWYRTPVFRDPDDDMLGGVVSGLCQSYGFDRRTSRLALVIAVPVLPIVIVAYVVAWILLPDGRDQAVPLEDIVRDKRRFPLYAALALLILAGGLGSLGSWLVFGDFPWGVGLIAIGILLWMAPGLRRDRAATAAATGLAAPMVAPTSTAGATTSWPTPAGVDATGGATDLSDPTHPGGPADAPHRVDASDPTHTIDTDTDTTSTTSTTSTSATTGATGTTGAVLVAPPMPTRARRRVPIGSISFVAMLAFVAIARIGDVLDWWNITALAVVITSLVIVAAGLAISAIVNRAWFFLGVVPVLAVAAGFLAVAEPSLDGGAGDRTARPATLDDLEPAYELGFGEFTLDLVDLPLADTSLPDDEPLRIEAEVGIGRLHVIVPAGARLVITSDVGAGHVVIGDREVFAGVDQGETRTLEAVGDEVGTIELDVRVGIGEIDIDRDLFGVAAVTDADTTQG